MRITDAPPLPKYWQLAEHLKQQVESGVLKPGDRLPSLAEMQAARGASRPTVEKAHALLEKEGLIIRRHGAGVFVAAPARKSTRGVIALSGIGFSFNGYLSYWAQIMGGVREAAAKAGTQVLVLEPESNRGWEKADGVLVCGWALHRVAPFRAAEVPVVSLMMPVPGVASVFADDYDGSRQATEHLIDLGHRRIGFLHAVSKQPILARRVEGYADALKAAKIRPLKSWQRSILGRFMSGPQIVEAARAEMACWLQNGWNKAGCTALLCHNDETAVGVMQALQAAKIKVPRDVSVVGFDGTEFCDLITPRLSSVEVPLREIGAQAVELLLQQIEADAVMDEHRILPVQWRARESTAAPRNLDKTLPVNSS